MVRLTSTDEAAFTHKGEFVLVAILNPVGMDVWDIVEGKRSTQVKHVNLLGITGLADIPADVSLSEKHELQHSFLRRSLNSVEDREMAARYLTE